ncbi:MAG TPA: aminotransferase class V-fold PLP-dependent enzyme [Acidobacteriota bacterium]|nr:aminotransferase class V-fold PLP-dependent enzyme [Acidobacteriota bacterium]
MNRTEPLVDPNRRAELFPVTRQWIYLNHAAVGPLPAYVLAAARHYLEAISRDGDHHWQETLQVIEETRALLAELVGARPEEIAFTRNASEGISVLANGLDWEPGDNVVLPAIEFPANVFPWQNLARRGVDVRYVPLRDGRCEAADIIVRVDGRTRVVSVSSVQFFNGFRLDLAPLGAFCRSRGVLFCVDAIQQLGALPLDVGSGSVDFLACGGHKWLMSGEGIGFLYCRAELLDRLHPAAVGWMGVRDWEHMLNYRLEFPPAARRFETGNLSAFGVHNLKAAVGRYLRLGPAAVAARILALAELAAEAAGQRGWTVLSPDGPARSGIVSFRVPGRDAADLVARLTAVGVQVAVRNGAIRMSPHYYNTAAEVAEAFNRLDRIVKPTDGR